MLTYAEQISTQISAEGKKKKSRNEGLPQIVKNSPSAEEIPAGPCSIACGRMNELICSHCASWIYSHTHAALISYINGLLQVNDHLCEGPFARNMDGVKTGWESRCCCHWVAHNPAIWLWRISFGSALSQRPDSKETQIYSSAVVTILDPLITVFSTRPYFSYCIDEQCMNLHNNL